MTAPVMPGLLIVQTLATGDYLVWIILVMLLRNFSKEKALFFGQVGAICLEQRHFEMNYPGSEKIWLTGVCFMRLR